MKKRKIYFAVLAGMLFLSGCGRAENKIAQQIKQETGDNINIEQSLDGIEDGDFQDNEKEMENINNGVLFSTEYDVEDYCQGCFIVSKNDGLLYGMLDRGGNEILPLEYDLLEFLNKDQVVNGMQENVYVRLRYENEERALDCAGQTVFDVKKGAYISGVRYEIGMGDSDSVFFEVMDEKRRGIALYNEDGALLFEKKCDENCYVTDMKYVTKNLWLMSEGKVIENSTTDITVEAKGVTLYNGEGKVINQWDGMMLTAMCKKISDDQYMFSAIGNQSGETFQYIMDTSGNVTENGEMSTEDAQEFFLNRTTEERGTNGEFYLGKDKKIKLYCSNDTWKLVDDNDEPLYDNRYYECAEESGCYFLSNEDNEICVINKNGVKVVDYGWFSRNGEAVYFNGTVLRTDDFFAGDDGVCVQQGGDIYFFKADN